MRLKLENIGILKKADIEINGISLIAGPNDSGKSTINKLFYSVIRGLNIDRKAFETEKNDFLKKDYQDVIKILRANNVDISEIQTDGINEAWLEKIKELNSFVKITKHQKEDFSKKIQRLDYFFHLDYDSKDAREEELFQYLTHQFNKQISSVFLEKESKIKIIDIEGESEFTINEYFTIKDSNKTVNLSNNIDLYYNEAIFIESPLTIDNSLESYISLFETDEKVTRNRKTHLKKILSNQAHKNDNLSKEHSQIINGIFNQLIKIISGEIIVDSLDGVTYKKNSEDINIDNVAIGIKSFGIIQLLLKKNRLNPRTLLIIDEPEIHLHPNWQIKYAEILVLLSQSLDIPMLLTSHSPYFIEAIEAFSKKYNFIDKTRFYLSIKDKDSRFSEIKDVSTNIIEILQSLSNAYYKINSINNELDNY